MNTQVDAKMYRLICARLVRAEATLNQVRTYAIGVAVDQTNPVLKRVVSDLMDILSPLSEDLDLSSNDDFSNGDIMGPAQPQNP